MLSAPIADAGYQIDEAWIILACKNLVKDLIVLRRSSSEMRCDTCTPTPEAREKPLLLSGYWGKIVRASASLDQQGFKNRFFWGHRFLLLINRRTASDGLHDFNILDLRLVEGVGIVCQHDKVSEFAGCDGSLDRLFV